MRSQGSLTNSQKTEKSHFTNILPPEIKGKTNDRGTRGNNFAAQEKEKKISTLQHKAHNNMKREKRGDMGREGGMSRAFRKKKGVDSNGENNTSQLLESNIRERKGKILFTQKGKRGELGHRRPHY